jgi:hypothetical protein
MNGGCGFFVAALAIDPQTPDDALCRDGRKPERPLQDDRRRRDVDGRAAPAAGQRAGARSRSRTRVTTSTVYAGTGSGIYKSVNGGGSWSQVDATINIDSLGIDPSAPGTVYAGFSGTGGLRKTTNGGASWNTITGGLPSSRVMGIAFESDEHPATIYVATQGHGAYKTTNGGTSWTAINTGLGATFLNAIIIDPRDADDAVHDRRGWH